MIFILRYKPKSSRRQLFGKGGVHIFSKFFLGDLVLQICNRQKIFLGLLLIHLHTLDHPHETLLLNSFRVLLRSVPIEDPIGQFFKILLVAVLMHVLHKFTKFVLVHSLVVHVVLLHVLPKQPLVFESRLAFGLNWVVQQTHHIS